MKILVTGDKGFIATHLQKKLRKDFPDALIIGFDEADYWSGTWLDKTINHTFDYVFHLAAIARTVDCTEDPFHRSFNSNILLTNKILSLLKFDRLIYASSCAIYGDQIHFPIIEESLPNPPSIYASQKLYSEKLIHYHCQSKKIPSVCLRLFNTYGPGQSQLGNYPNVIASLTKSEKEKGYVEVTGDGLQTRDFVYVDDVVNAFILAMNIHYKNHIYNVCSGREKSINMLASIISENVCYVPERPFDIRYQVASYEKIKNELGWIPQTSLADGLAKTI